MFENKDSDCDCDFKQDHDRAQLFVLQQRDLTVQIENIKRD